MTRSRATPASRPRPARNRASSLARGRRAMTRSGACALAALAAGGCISKSVYLKQVDEAVQARSRAEACDKRLRSLGDVKGDLEEQLRAMDRRRALAMLDGDKCREQLAKR